MSTAETDKPARAKTGIGAHLGSHLRENGMMLALVAIVLFFFIMVRATQGVDFLSAQNITNLFLQNSYVIIMALGMLLVIVAGHIDLSVGSVAAFTGAVASMLLVKMQLPVLMVIPMVLVVGGLIGAAQGYWIAYWRIPSFIVTLAGMLVFRGLTLMLCTWPGLGGASGPWFTASAGRRLPSRAGPAVRKGPAPTTSGGHHERHPHVGRRTGPRGGWGLPSGGRASRRGSQRPRCRGVRGGLRPGRGRPHRCLTGTGAWPSSH